MSRARVGGALTSARRPARVVGFVERLARFGDRPCLVVGDDALTYAEVARLVEDRAHQLGPERSLVLVRGGNDVELVTTYLAALAAGHVVWMAPPGDEERIRGALDAHAPDTIATVAQGSTELVRRADPSAHPDRLHPDLALLLGTSGSTGSSKLVRLSHRNVESNAAAIATYLSLRPDDRGITSLPLHYCYGLSVLHSHLSVGASVVVTDRSVVDPCFWAQVDRHGVTNIAGVPHTFELLERSSFASRAVPSLRFLTQAGGRMPPERVRRFAELGRARGFELFVMYGQTEATARMAYLPPHLATEHPDAVGVPIPGGSIEIRPPEGHGAAPDGWRGPGEIVYRGPNVMMGYAERGADLSLGRTVDELRTGDIGVVDEQGLLRVVGRAARFVKPFGVRVDLDELERVLRRGGWDVLCTGDDHTVSIAVSSPPPGDVPGDVPADVQGDVVADVVVATLGVPRRVVRTVVVDELPATPSGKPDYAAVARLAGAAQAGPPVGVDATVPAVFARVLGRASVDEDRSFVELGGDSLSYVELATRLAELLGDVPDGWHLMPVRELAALRPQRRRTTRIETGVVLRAVAITTIVGTHMHAFRAPGGAHLLLALAGMNYARFQLGLRSARERVRASLATIARIAVPTSAWIGIQMLLVGGYGVGALLLVNNYTGSSWRREGRWQYWYFEAFVQLFAACTLLLLVPAVRRWERRWPFAFALGLLSVALALRFELVQLGDPYNYLYRTHTVAWCFVMGWAAQRAATTSARVLLSAISLVAVPGYFEFEQRNTTVLVGLLVLIWLPKVPVPRVAARPIATLAAASMYVFLVHWQVWPPLDRALPREAALPLTLASGVAVWFAVTRASRWLSTSRSARAAGATIGRHRRSIGEVPGPELDRPTVRSTTP